MSKSEFSPAYQAISKTLMLEQAVGIGLLAALAPTNEQALVGSLVIGGTILVKKWLDHQIKLSPRPLPDTTNDLRRHRAGKVVGWLPNESTVAEFQAKSEEVGQADVKVDLRKGIFFRRPTGNDED